MRGISFTTSEESMQVCEECMQVAVLLACEVSWLAVSRDFVKMNIE